MVQLDILSGKKAGEHWLARRFPVHIGRALSCDLCLEEDGVWEQHATLELDTAQGFLISAQSDALLNVNNESVRSTRLRNGDSIMLGAARMRFRLADPRQRNLRLQEWLLWLVIATVAAAQIVLVYRVLE
jgi:predicted component of type VI protein secretion system